jgi:hypothetical protein
VHVCVCVHVVYLCVCVLYVSLSVCMYVSVGVDVGERVNACVYSCILV